MALTLYVFLISLVIFGTCWVYAGIRDWLNRGDGDPPRYRSRAKVTTWGNTFIGGALAALYVVSAVQTFQAGSADLALGAKLSSTLRYVILFVMWFVSFAVSWRWYSKAKHLHAYRMAQGGLFVTLGSIVIGLLGLVDL